MRGDRCHGGHRVVPCFRSLQLVLIGGSLAGFVGALLALPMAAIIKIAFRELYLEERLEEVGAPERYER